MKKQMTIKNLLGASIDLPVEPADPGELSHNKSIEERLSILKKSDWFEVFPVGADAVNSLEDIHLIIKKLPLSSQRYLLGCVLTLLVAQPKLIPEACDLFDRFAIKAVKALHSSKDETDRTLNLMDAEGNRLKLSDVLGEV